MVFVTDTMMILSRLGVDLLLNMSLVTSAFIVTSNHIPDVSIRFTKTTFDVKKP